MFSTRVYTRKQTFRLTRNFGEYLDSWLVEYYVMYILIGWMKKTVAPFIGLVYAYEQMFRVWPDS